METLTSGDDGVVPHHSRKKRKSFPAGHTPLLDTPQTDEKELRKKEKKKRRLEAECTEIMDLDDDAGMGQGSTSNEAGQSATKGTTPRKKKKKQRIEAECTEKIDLDNYDDRGMGKGCTSDEATQETKPHKKKKKKKKKDLVLLDEEEKGEEHSEVPVVVETSISKKKKKHHNMTVEENIAVVTTNDNSQNTVGPLAKAKNLKKKSVVVTESMDVTPDLGVERLEGQPVAGGGPLEDEPFHKEKKSKKKRNKEIQKELREELDQLQMTELMLYVPGIESRPLSVIQNMLRYDLTRFREFKQKGIDLRTGRWLMEENVKIRQNVANFLALTSIPSASHLFFPDRHMDPGMQNIRKMRVANRFTERIAEGIPRPCFKVYIRGRKIFDELNYKGRFTEEEVNLLKKKQLIHGNNWVAVSQGMERSIYSIQKRFSMMKTVIGTWSPKERDVLEGAIKVHLKKLAAENQAGAAGDGASAGSGPEELWVTRRQLYHNLPWKSISEEVPGRSWVQCREKWFTILKPKIASRKAGQPGGFQRVLPRITLINTLYAMDLEDPAEIDWEHVSECVGNVTPYTTQKMLNMLKVTSVPHSSVLTYSETIDFLHDKVIPMLRRKVRLEDVCPLESEEVRQRYVLSQIFSEEEFVELDLTA
ncbi:transcription termination factor 1-like [Gadus macrocephalus]|uniref:transcription termination factor 1-like n=1 Tax=Gadus macrocephalus TaxID=80720 RepID=UPI0028CB6B28|nr:transcription termination factor 1-like [Gadus macrocephalus]